MGERRVRLVLVGWGAICRAAHRWMTDPGIEVVGVAVRDTTRARGDVPATARIISDPSELAALEPDLVAEAAGRESVAPWGHATFEAGADLIVSSVSAFADPAALAALRVAGARTGSQLQIQPGALAGVEALAAARAMGVDVVEHRMVKPPLAWRGTPAESLCDLDGLKTATAFFTASANEAASQFPKNANVAMTTALAGVGPEATKITMVADPGATTNRHELSAHGAFGQLDVTIANNPLPDNPKSSAMAALSLVRAIENRTTGLVI